MKKASLFMAVDFQIDPESVRDDPRVVFDLERFRQVIRETEWAVCDTETTGLKPELGDRLFSVQFYHPNLNGGVPIYLDTRIVGRSEAIEAIRFAFGPDGIRNTIWQHAAFDIKILAADGIEVAGKVFDTKVFAHDLTERLDVENPFQEIKWSRYYSLSRLGKYFGIPEKYRKIGDELKAYMRTNGIADPPRFDRVELPMIVEYGCQDVIATYHVWEAENRECRKQEVKGKPSLLAASYEHQQIAREFGLMELRGLAADMEFLTSARERLAREKQEAQEKIDALAGYPVDAGREGEIFVALTGVRGLQWPKWGITKKGKRSTKKEVLESFKDPLADAILEWREIDKLLGTYVIPWIETHATPQHTFHSDFNQCGTSTGRASAEDPNFLNIPVRSKRGAWIRNAFRVRDGYVMFFVDYSQIEYRLFAFYSRDVNLIQGYMNDPDFDIHAAVAEALFGHFTSDADRKEKRQKGKTINFGLIYGMGAEKLAVSLGLYKFDLAGNKVPHEDAAYEVLNDYYNKYPGIRSLRNGIKNTLQRRGFLINVFGHRVRLPPVIQHKGMNYLIQGTNGHLTKRAMMRVGPFARAHGGGLLNMIYDDINFELPGTLDETLPLAKYVRDEIMPDWGTLLHVPNSNLYVPIKADLEFSTTTWAEKQKAA